MSDNFSSNDFKELRWVRVFTPIHIPKYLVEQVKHRDYAVEDFYTYQEEICIDESTGDLNPFNHLYVIVNGENIVVGFLWFCVDPLTKDIAVQIFSMDSKYWNKGQAMEFAAEHLKKIRRKAKLKKIYWVTRYPKHSEKHGFKRSKHILMEYDEDKING